ncbi:CHAT domain-containing protein [Amycolatopsis sp. NBC_01286]|uniref:CHAT domain-containing protein n=1 Tax=Amycolatopsis sp. NBC_01286 TaxID=2903560 RepID=UPI002E12ACD5|nr:CHAT domain-containing protein [Amycolatopsis sp. NBC_01286]
MTVPEPVAAGIEQLRGDLASAGYDREAKVRADLCAALVEQYDSGEVAEDPEDLAEARYHAEWILAVVPPGELEWMMAQMVLRDACQGLLGLAGDDADPELLDVAIEAGRCVTEFDPTALNRLTQGEMLLEREGTDREGEGDLAEAVTLLEAARADGPDGDLGTAVTVTLGFALTRWERLRAEPGAVERLTRPIELLTGSLGALGQGYISRDEVLYNLAELHTLRYVSPEFERTGADLAELDQAVEYLQGVREKDHPMVVERLASALYMRLGEAADPMDAEMGIRVLTRVARDGKDALEEQQREIFGDFLLERAKRVPTLENVEAVIEYLEEARKGSGSGTPMGLTLLQAYALRSGLAPGTLEPVIALLDETIAGESGTGLSREWLRTVRSIALAETAVLAGDLASAAAEAEFLSVQARHRSSLDSDLTLVLSVAAVIRRLRDQPGREPPFTGFFARLAAFDADDMVVWLHWFDQADSPPGGADELTAVALLRSYLVDESEPGASRHKAVLAAIECLSDADAALASDDPVRLVVQQRLGIHHADLARHVSDGEADIRRAAAIFDDLLVRLEPDHPLCRDTLYRYGAVITIAAMYRATVIDHDTGEKLLREAAEDPGNSRDYRAHCLASIGHVDMLRFAKERRPERMAAGMACFRRIAEILPRGDPRGEDALHTLALAHVDRFGELGDLRDIDLAMRYVEQLQAGPCTLDEAELARTAAHLRAVRAAAGAQGLAVDLDEHIAELVVRFERDSAAITGTAMTHAHVLVEGNQLADLLAMRAMHAGDLADVVSADSVMARVLELTPPGNALYASFEIKGVLLTVLTALITADRARFDGALARLEVLGASPDPQVTAFLPWLLAASWLIWHTATNSTEARENALRAFEAATSGPAGTTNRGLPMLGGLAASAYWDHGTTMHAERAVEISFSLLGQQAREVLLQSGGDHGLARAQKAAEQSLLLTLRCLALGDRHRAVEAIEAGRGMVLGAVSTAANLGAELRRAGHQGLADEWELAATDADRFDDEESSLLTLAQALTAPAAVSDLRHRVLEALSTEPAGSSPSRPPGAAEITAALREIGADVLCYLIPCQGEAYGRALLVFADGALDEVVLPLLRDDDGAYLNYLDVRGRADSAERGSPAARRWAGEVDAIVEWAWEVAMRPVAARVRRLIAGTPRLVVIACGGLGAVPWHAAGPAGRPLVHEMTVSYASTARQLCEVAGRATSPLGERPVVVTDPEGSLVGSQEEAAYLRGIYPGGRFYGRAAGDAAVVGAGTPEEVHLASRSASMLHLSCHARSGAVPSESALLLAGGTLTVERILRPGGRRTLPGGLVVLAACQSDLTSAAHDEVLTLGASFISAGATGVVGSRWSVDDVHSSLMMCVLHRELVEFGRAPAEALRAAQLWALDPDRQAPPGLPDGLARRAASDELSRPHAWAAFGYLGR